MRLVSRRRCAVGLGMRDCLARAARVPAAGGAFSRAAALVLNLVLRAGAVAGTGVGTGTDIMRRLRLIIGLGRMSMCAVVGTLLGAGAGVIGMSLDMDRVMRRVGSQLVSTLEMFAPSELVASLVCFAPSEVVALLAGCCLSGGWHCLFWRQCG